jgi:hypothetical protein
MKETFFEENTPNKQTVCLTVFEYKYRESSFVKIKANPTQPNLTSPHLTSPHLT